MIQTLEQGIELVERHVQVFRLVITHQPIGIVKLSKQTGFSRPRIRYSLRLLERAELIEPTREGAITTDELVRSLIDTPTR